jgi:hypothetical protein
MTSVCLPRHPAVAYLFLVSPMGIRAWCLPLFIGFAAVVHASDNSVEVTLEDTPELQQTQTYYRWKSTPQEVDSDSNYTQWRDKFLTGSGKRLGSAADAAAIKRLVPATIPPTIRWLSRRVVVVVSGCRSEASSSGKMRCLYVFEKQRSKWKLTHHYRTRARPILL